MTLLTQTRRVRNTCGICKLRSARVVLKRHRPSVCARIEGPTAFVSNDRVRIPYEDWKVLIGDLLQPIGCDRVLTFLESVAEAKAIAKQSMSDEC